MQKFLKTSTALSRRFIRNHSLRLIFSSNQLFLRFYTKNFSSSELRFENFQLLQYAAKGDLDSIKNLLETHPDIDVNCKDYDGRTALHLSTEEGFQIFSHDNFKQVTKM